MFEVWYRSGTFGSHVLHGDREKAEIYAEQMSAKHRGRFTVIDPRGYTVCHYQGGRILRDEFGEVIR